MILVVNNYIFWSAFLAIEKYLVHSTYLRTSFAGIYFFGFFFFFFFLGVECCLEGSIRGSSLGCNMHHSVLSSGKLMIIIIS